MQVSPSTQQQTILSGMGADISTAEVVHIAEEQNEPIVVESAAQTLCIIVEQGITCTMHEMVNDEIEREVYLLLADEAELHYAQLQNAASGATIRIQQRSTLGTHSKLHIHNITLGGNKVEHDLVNTVEGEGSESSVDWIFYAKKKEKHNISVRNVFNAREGGGEITMKGVAEDTANVAVSGMIDIGLQGGGTDAYLTEDVLMLDHTAKVDAIPGLEIKTNDVKASHSATVTKVSPNDLFYFGSRGIDEATARQMYIEGFLGELTERIEDEEMRAVVLEAIDNKYQL